MMLGVCSVIDHSSKMSKWGKNISLYAPFVLLPHHDIICARSVNRCKATWNLFAKLNVLAGENNNRQCHFISGVLHTY